MKRRVPVAWNGGSRERALDGNGGTIHTLCPQCRGVGCLLPSEGLKHEGAHNATVRGYRSNNGS
jgi:hypothetical protein